ncbi:MAG: ketopantoate reductase family protein [Lachnospiraceae bacterium]|nr:ketopantoate reductase family protein [Lachnospiraceae bacterium]
MRVLIYGAGVIGSLYAALLSEAGVDITVYARGKRLRDLQTKGLLYNRNGRIESAKITVISSLDDHDRYDCIFLTVREDQLMTALAELKDNISPTILTMVNSLDPYERWEEVCGSGRILPAFPGAGGSLEGGVLDAELTPRIIQPTTIGRTDGREKELAALFRRAHIPYQIVSDMHVWQICHLGMVVPIADAYYEADDAQRAGEDPLLMNKTARRIRRNFRIIKDNDIKLSPVKMNIFLILPVSTVAFILGLIFRSEFGNRFMYQHSMKAPNEMRRLHKQLYTFLGSCRR